MGQPARLDELRELAAGHARDVEQRSQRPRCEQRIARSPDDARRVPDRLAETTKEGGLARADLAADEHEPAAARLAHRRERLLEHRESRRSFEEGV